MDVGIDRYQEKKKVGMFVGDMERWKVGTTAVGHAGIGEFNARDRYRYSQVHTK